MELALCPYIRRAWYNTLQPNEDIHERVIFDYELLYVKSGRSIITVENQEFICNKGDIFIFRPRQKHAIRVAFDEPLVQPHIHFDLTYSKDRKEVPVNYSSMIDLSEKEKTYFREDILDQFISPFPSHFHPHSSSFIEQMLFDLIYTYSSTSPWRDIALSRIFLQLWEQVLNEISYDRHRITNRSDIARHIKTIIEQNVTHTLSLSELSEMTHFSRSYISRVFQESYDISPMRYHSMLRIQKARSMIQLTNMSLSEIASELGFESLQDFSRVFKRYDGMPPSALRHSQ